VGGERVHKSVVEVKLLVVLMSSQQMNVDAEQVALTPELPNDPDVSNFHRVKC